MTERERLELEDTKQRLADRCGWRCEVCGRPILDGQPQLAHRIAKSKANLAKYGEAVIHHDLNLAMVCCLKCNDAVLVSKPDTVAELLAEIQGGLF